MYYSITIKDKKLPSLNELIFKAKGHWGAYAGLKKKWKKIVNDSINPNAVAFTKPVDIDVIIYFKDKRKRDLDNYVPKLLFDGLTKKENPNKFILYDDSTVWIKSYAVHIQYEAEFEGVTMVIDDE